MPRLLILGTGSMAENHAKAFLEEKDIPIVAAVESNPERLAAFSDRFGIANRFTDLDAAIAWGGFDAATNVTPDAVHYPTTMKLIAAGKHVLCEKPLATVYPLAKEMADAAEAAQLVNMVNLTYRASPALQEARRMVIAGDIGELRHIDATYYQGWLVGKYWGDWRSEERWLWRLSTEHGSNGVVGDIGIHTLDFATYAAASDIASFSSEIRTFHKADGDRIGKYGLDANDSLSMTVSLANGALGAVQLTRFAAGNMNDLRVSLFGTKGSLRLMTDGRKSVLEACIGADIDTNTWRILDPPPAPSTWRRFADALRSGRNGEPDFRRAADLQRILDLILARSGQGVITIA